MSDVYDTLVLGKTSYELGTLAKLVCNDDLMWENASFVDAEQPTRENFFEGKNFEFGTTFPELLDQFEHETYFYHYRVYLVGKGHLVVPKYRLEEKALYLHELNNANEMFAESLAYVYLEEKDWEKSLDLFIPIVEKQGNVYLFIFIALLARINRNLKQSLSHFVRAHKLGVPAFLLPSILLWIGEICASLTLDVWAVTMYQDCIRIVEDRAQKFHWFVNLPFIYAKLAHLMSNKGDDIKLESTDTMKYLLISFREYEKDYETFIPQSQFTRDYQQVCVGLQISRRYYNYDRYEEALLYLTHVEKRLLSLVNSDSQENRNMIGYLLDTYRRLSMVHVHRNNLSAKRYVRLPKFTVDLTNLTVAEQYELKKKDAERREMEERVLATFVTDQNHIIQYLTLCSVALMENDKLLYCELVELALRPSVTGFNDLPIHWYQKITSRLIFYGEYKQAQMTLSKCMLIYHDFTLGWYVLFLLSILNNDWNYMVGSFAKFPKFQDKQRYWQSTLKLSKKFEKLQLQKSKL